jgi:hypothetical protein
MKRYGLLLATVGMVLLTAGVLYRAGWLSRPSPGAAPARGGRAKNADVLASPAGWRYRQNQRHWRYSLLNGGMRR